jgi:hypothetical protein
MKPEPRPPIYTGFRTPPKDRDIRFIKLEPQSENWVKVGEVCIDSGRLLLTDPAYVGDLPKEFLGARVDMSGAVGNADVAMLVAARPGDGGYPVRVKYSDGEVIAVRVDFLRHTAPGMGWSTGPRAGKADQIRQT